MSYHSLSSDESDESRLLSQGVSQKMGLQPHQTIHTYAPTSIAPASHEVKARKAVGVISPLPPCNTIKAPMLSSSDIDKDLRENMSSGGWWREEGGSHMVRYVLPSFVQYPSLISPSPSPPDPSLALHLSRSPSSPCPSFRPDLSRSSSPDLLGSDPSSASPILSIAVSRSGGGVWSYVGWGGVQVGELAIGGGELPSVVGGWVVQKGEPGDACSKEDLEDLVIFSRVYLSPLCPPFVLAKTCTPSSIIFIMLFSFESIPHTLPQATTTDLPVLDMENVTDSKPMAGRAPKTCATTPPCKKAPAKKAPHSNPPAKHTVPSTPSRKKALFKKAPVKTNPADITGGNGTSLNLPSCSQQSRFETKHLVNERATIRKDTKAYIQNEGTTKSGMAAIPEPKYFNLYMEISSISRGAVAQDEPMFGADKESEVDQEDCENYTAEDNDEDGILDNEMKGDSTTAGPLLEQGSYEAQDKTIAVAKRKAKEQPTPMEDAYTRNRCLKKLKPTHLDTGAVSRADSDTPCPPPPKIKADQQSAWYKRIQPAGIDSANRAVPMGGASEQPWYMKLLPPAL
ncbi:hypothetical protein BDK51DRAFT_31087 [Blyttiomyces helicus]|uniref:Uncharacterized protein n=1 Tax=Blyttiomyces helicus TaxID=388810 RepID=A0A4P9WBJ7_9FUNG|nr:hypothetical protein BDK51DRAFT_31087 [Blyttiomyces helicus]|eukprot:RKO87666.1 hypothetical protein BDK51DRAFT_31087 [Blyttiomyces helicus]